MNKQKRGPMKKDHFIPLGYLIPLALIIMTLIFLLSLNDLHGL